MFRYEVLMLTIPEITKDEVAAIESQLANVVQQHKGALISFERWGKYRLAYPIKKHEYGVYCLARFETPAKDATLKDVHMLLGVKLEDSVMRFVITQLDANAPLAYQRPLSLEEAPAKSASPFSRERGFFNDGYNKRGRDVEERSHPEERHSAEEHGEAQEQEHEIA